MRKAKFFASLFITAMVCGCGDPKTSQNAPLNSLELTGLTADRGRSTNLLAVGDWSKPVKDRAGYSLRGRLLVFDTPHYGGQSKEWWGNAPVYVELENLSPRTDQALAVYFALGDGLECDLRDARGKPLPPPSAFFSYNGPPRPWTRQCWIVVPFDGSVRLRADPQVGGFSPKSSGLTIGFSMGKRWTIPAGDTNYFLSGTFSPPTNHPSPPTCHVWQGKLELPAVRVPSPGP